MKKKKLLVVGILALLAIVAVVVAVIVSKGYRVIKVEEFDGEVTLERADKEKEVFEGLKLKSEDTITTEEDGLVELLVDEDKHILAKENTCFTIQSSGNKKKGKLTIELEYGTSLVEIENKLPDDYDVEVETPNASLSVRGTTFEVTYDKAAKTTTLKVMEGVVRVENESVEQNVEGGEKAVITEDKIEVKELPAIYTEDIAFELKYYIGGATSGVHAKQLADWKYGHVEAYGVVIDQFMRDGVTIRYNVISKAGIDSEIKTMMSAGNISATQEFVNSDNDKVMTVTYDYLGEETKIKRAYRYYRKITEDMYLDVYVFDEDNGQSMGDATVETFVDMTQHCYYVYGPEISLDTSNTDSGALSEGSEAVTPMIPPVEKPFSKVYISNSEFPDLIKGGSSYDQMRYMIKIALVADMNGHKDYLKEALYLICHEGYQTDVFPPIEGTENVYDIDMLNNMFSFLTDEKIEEKHLNEGSTISGNQLTTYRDRAVWHELTAVGLASTYYGENGEIVIEFIAEKHTIVDGASGPILEFKGTAYLIKDETDKYVFDHLEWEER